MGKGKTMSSQTNKVSKKLNPPVKASTTTVKTTRMQCHFTLPKCKDNRERIQLIASLRDAGVQWNQKSSKVISDYFMKSGNSYLETQNQLEVALKDLQAKEELIAKQQTDLVQPELQQWQSLNENLAQLQNQMKTLGEQSKLLQESRKELHEANSTVVNLKVQLNHCKCQQQSCTPKRTFDEFVAFLKNLKGQNKDFKQTYKSEICAIGDICGFDASNSSSNCNCNCNLLSTQHYESALLHDVNMGYGMQAPRIDLDQHRKQLLWKWWNYCDKPCTEGGNYTIHEAVISENYLLVNNLCQLLKVKRSKAKNPLDVVNCNLETPFHLAIIYNVSPKITKLLYEKGSNLYQKDANGNNFLHLAVIHEYLEQLVVCEISFNADELLNRHNYEGFTPLHLAVLRRKLRECELLVKMKADLNVIDLKSGRTALFHAVESNNVAICELLYRSKADREIANYDGCSVIRLLSEKASPINPEIYKLFYTDLNRYSKECLTGKSSENGQHSKRNKRNAFDESPRKRIRKND